ncbi:MAG: bifunctional nicotinamidase/pyrazinamidase [Treponema sp.]|jgi:nicotinamidase/pyrazinamidase|nr:bifunctional nicotinamidase/pyrazinamidase [Treponema sp.]
MTITIPNAALLEIDVQNDFCPAYTAPSGERMPAGALAVAGGDAVIPPLNALARRFAQEGGKVIATADWHPPDHVSFAASHPGKKPGDSVFLPPGGGRGKPQDGPMEQLLWASHCVQGQAGACFHALLDTDPAHLIIRKGYRKALDSYSAFFENDQATPTGLNGYLRGLPIDTVILGGLAEDYCVLYSALDARRLGYRTIVVLDAVRGVGIPEGSVERARKTMENAGILLIQSKDIL